MRYLCALSLAMLLAGCGTSAPYRYDNQPPGVSTNPSPVLAHPLARTTTYACEDLTTVVLTEGVPDARATLNSGLEMSLARLRFGVGHYGAPPYEFRALGAEGMWINQGRVARCRVK